MQRLQEKEGEFLKENQIEGKIFFFLFWEIKNIMVGFKQAKRGFLFLLFCIISPPLFKKIYMDWVVEL